MSEGGFGRFVDDRTLQYERIFAHPIERVWRAITDPAEMAEWMFAPDEWDLRPGGAWRMGCNWSGIVAVLEPPRRLRLDHAPGQPEGASNAYMHYELESVVGGTRLVFTHSLPGLEDGLARDPDGVAGGWHEILDRLTEQLDGRPIGAGLPETEFSRTAAAWLAAKAGAPDEASARQHVLDLRREEAGNHLNRRYRERAAAGGGGQSDAGLGRFLDRHTLEFVRTYPHPIERVWRAITDPKDLARWFIPTTKWEFHEGGAYRFHDDGFMGEIATIEAPRFIRFGSRSLPGQEPGSFFQYELTPVEGGTRLRFVQHAAAGAVWEGRPEGRNDVPWAGGNLGGWHEFWEALGAHLDGAPADSRMPPTRMSELVADWVRKVQIEYGMDPKLGARIRIGLRREERWAELNALYEKIIDETLPPATAAEGGGRP
ncbi:MAG TPA: SRPBCC domain-containing protein [Caulobacteraceae bacterium]